MSETVYKDYTPANARIVINYRKGEKVKFSYPIDWTYRKAVIHRALPTIFQFWLMLHLKIIIIGSIYILLPACIGATLALLNAGIPIDLSLTESVPINFPFNKFFLLLLLSYGYAFLTPVVITGILSLNKDRLSKWMPKLGYYTSVMTGRIKIKTFAKDDVVDKKAIIPYFSNVYLNYEASGDFEKYLNKVEILEIPFDYLRKNIILFFMKEKREKNDFKYRAVFYFNKHPEKGKLETKFG